MPTNKRSIMIVESSRVGLLTVQEQMESTNNIKVPANLLEGIKGAKGETLLTLEGVFGQVGTINANNRKYLKENYQSHIEILNSKIRKAGGVLGQLEHPNSLAINLAEASHVINKELRIDENGIVRGGISLLDNAFGKQAHSIIKAGLPLYISSRGRGTIDDNGVVELVEMSTYDLVATPGFSNAELRKISESIDENLHYVYLDSSTKPTIYESAYVEGKETIISEMKDKKKEDEEENDVPTPEETIKNLEKEIEDIKESHKNDLQAVQENMINLMDSYIEKEVKTKFQKDLKEQETVLTTAIENYVKDSLNETLGKISKYLEDELTPQIQESMKDWVIESVAPAIQKWTTEEYGGVMEGYIEKELVPSISGWVTESIIPTISNYLDTEYKDEIKESLNSPNKKSKKKMISEGLEINEDLTEVDVEDIIDFNEAIEKSKQHLLKYKKKKEQVLAPSYLTNIPEGKKELYESLSEKNKELVKDMASKRISNPTAEQINEFWESVDLTKFVNESGEDKVKLNDGFNKNNTIIDASIFDGVFENLSNRRFRNV